MISFKNNNELNRKPRIMQVAFIERPKALQSLPRKNK